MAAEQLLNQLGNLGLSEARQFRRETKRTLTLADELGTVDPIFEEAIEEGVRDQLSQAMTQEARVAGPAGGNRVSSFAYEGAVSRTSLAIAEARRQSKMARISARAAIMSPLGQISTSLTQQASQGLMQLELYERQARTDLLNAVIGGVAGVGAALVTGGAAAPLVFAPGSTLLSGGKG